MTGPDAALGLVVALFILAVCVVVYRMLRRLWRSR